MLRPYRKSLRAVRQEFRDRLADRLGEALIIGTEARQRMVGIDVQLYASRHRNPPPRRGPHRLLDGIARQPRRQRAAGPAARHAFRPLQRQALGGGERRPQDLGTAPVQDVAGLVVHVLGDGGERVSLHLPQLYRQQFEKMLVGVRRAEAVTLWWSAVPARYVQRESKLP